MENHKRLFKKISDDDLLKYFAFTNLTKSKEKKIQELALNKWYQASIEFINKNDELDEKYIRLNADFINYRKNKEKEISEIKKNAGIDLIVKLIPILDDIDIMIRFNPDNEDFSKEN